MTNDELISIIQAKSDGLKFIEDGHKYFIGEKEVPSVSKIMEPLTRLVYGDGTYANYQTGTDVHFAIKSYLVDGWQVWDDAIDGYMQGFIKWYDSMKDVMEIVAIETPITDGEIAGTPDLVCLINGEPCIIDFKTGKSAKWNTYKCQLGAYAKMLDGYGWQTGIVQLKGDSEYKLKWLTKEIGMFETMLAVYRYSKKRNTAD